MALYHQAVIFRDLLAELTVWTLLFEGPEEHKDFSGQVTHLRQSENPIHALP